MGDKTKFAERLKQCMFERGIKNSELACELGITHGSVYQWLNGMTTPTQARINRIADIFGVSKEWLSGEDVPKDKEIKRNASGYTDPTAFAAIKTVEKEGLKKMHELRKGDIYEYTLQNGTGKYALVMSDERRNDHRTVAIIVLEERELGIAILCRTTMYANPNRLSYGYVDNFGSFVRKAKPEEMEAIEQATLAATGFTQKNIQLIESDAAEKIKQMIKALKDENEDKEKCIESLQRQIRTLSAECSKLASGVPNEMHNAELMKAHIERDIYKNLYEQAIERMIDR